MGANVEDTSQYEYLLSKDIVEAIIEVFEFSLDLPNVADYYNKLLLQKAMDKSNNHAIGLAKRNYCYVYVWKYEMREALKNGLESYSILKDSTDYLGISTVTYLISSIYMELGSFEQALEYTKIANETALISKNRRWQAWALENYSSYYIYRGEYTKAKEQCEKILSIFEELNHVNGIVRIKGQLGYIAKKTGDVEGAVKIYEDILKTENIASPMMQAQRISFAEILTENCRFEEAEKQFHILRANSELDGVSIYVSQTQIAWARILLHKNDREGSIKTLQQVWSIAEEEGRKIDMLDLCRAFSDMYEIMGDYEKALKWSRKYQQVREDLFMEESNQRARNLEIKYAVEKAEAEAVVERKKNKEIENLLLNILPKTVAEELQTTGRAKPVDHEMCTVLFADFVNFTPIASRLKPEALVGRLHEIFSVFDTIMDEFKIEKLKTMGDAYIAVSGVPDHREDHCSAAVYAAMKMIDASRELTDENGELLGWQLRVGLHSGSVVSGVVGTKKFAFDIWGDTVNTASRMEQNSYPGKITVSSVSAQFLAGLFLLSSRGLIAVKGIGEMELYFVDGIKQK
jgi:adenylate cyclase